MGLRKSSSYSKFKARPYTRKSKNRSKSYIKTVPFSKIVKFTSGSQMDYDAGKHKWIVKLSTVQDIQIRDNSLEACRMFITKILEEKMPGQYYFNIKVHPHHMLRENKTAAGAGADRISTGMAHSFGMVIGRAAMVKAGGEIFVIACTDDKTARIARDILHTIKAKIPCNSRIVMAPLTAENRM